MQAEQQPTEEVDYWKVKEIDNRKRGAQSKVEADGGRRGKWCTQTPVGCRALQLHGCVQTSDKEGRQVIDRE